MGNITTVKILNDYTGMIREYGATFTNLLCDALSSGKLGELVPGVTITDMCHSSNYTSKEDLQKEIKELRGWKESAIAIMPDYQAIGLELGLHIGQSVYDKILPAIKQLKKNNLNSNDVEQLLNQLEASHKVTTPKAAIVEIRKLIRGLVHEHSHS